MTSGALGIDYAWARPDLAAAKRAGYSFIARYLAPDNASTKGRVITAGEVAAARQLGMGVVLVWEWTASRSSQGYTAGQQDARAANDQADALGFPRDRPIYFATDFDGTASAVKPYYQGAVSASVRPVGVYGGIRPVDALLGDGTCAYGWQTVAWSGGRVSTQAHLYQRIAPTRTIPGVKPTDIDENVSLRPDFGAAWTQEDDMAGLTDQEHNWLAAAVMLGEQQQARMGDVIAATAPGLIEGWYDKYLGRPPKKSPDEVAQWVASIVAGKQTLAGAEAYIATSAEAKAYAAKAGKG